MLFFCEECGGKNIVPDVSPEQTKISFRCQHCQYETVVERKKQPQHGGEGQAEEKASQKAGSASGKD